MRKMPTKTLFDKVWDQHVVVEEEGCPAVLYIDLHLIHEVTSPQAFSGLRARKLRVRRPEKTVATMDHSIPTTDSLKVVDSQAAAQLAQLEANCAEFGITLHGMRSERRGIVHVIGPELGLTQPGMTVVCGDSHTSTHGAFGALAFGIGTSEVEHVLASQCLLQRRPKTLEVRVDGALGAGVVAKDVILALIAQIGTAGGAGHVLEYRGNAISALDMEGRMTVCNMSIEAGARAGLIAPDDVTFQYLAGREHAPKDWERAVQSWRGLVSDEGARFDSSVTLDAAKLEPMITFGTNPGQGVAITQPVPANSANKKALDYMALESGRPLLGKKIDVVFVGSCTNGRISDLRQAARIFEGRKVTKGVRALVVPGSQAVRKQAEAEGLDRIFVAAGAEWRQPGCSMCIAMNGDMLEPGQYAVSTSNRNFEGRQGKGGRTFLASPLTAAAAAVTGEITDPRTLL
jgi:3-isopropylmalate/(R)-2-methylmalate dehydratase large subunit